MKKMRNILALLACAVLAWGVTACSSDDSDGGSDGGNVTPSATLTVADNAFTVEEAGATVSADVTVTLKNDSFKALAAGTNVTAYVTVTPADVLTITSVVAKNAVAAGAMSATVTVTGSVQKAGDFEVTFKGAALSSGKDLKATTKIKAKVAGDADDGTLSGWWSLDEYVTDLKIPASTEEITADTTVGPVKILAPAKWTSAGEFTIEGAKKVGYVQLGIPDAGTEGKKKGLQFTVPKGATKITVYGKNDQNLALIKQGDTTAVEKVVDGATADYAAFSWDITASENTVYTVYHNKETAKATINLKAINVEVPGAVLESIAVTDLPTKTEYAVGAALDLTGLKVTATYSNGKSKVVTSACTVSELDALTAGEKELTVTYKEGEVTKTATFKVTVKAKALSSIAVKTNPTKVEYVEGDAIDLAGLVITLTYDDSSSEDVAYAAAISADFTTDFDSSVAAESKEVTVTYKGKTAKFSVKINKAKDFTAFLASDLAGDVTLEADGEFKAADGTWILTSSAKGTIQKKAISTPIATYDYDATAGTGFAYTARMAANGTGRSMKLLIGKGVTKVIRIDAGTSKGNISDASETATIKIGDSSWDCVLAGSTKYFSVTGDAETGYVTITFGTNKTNVYGIHVVDAVVDTSDKVRTYEALTYNKPVVTLAEKANVNTAVTAEVAKPTSSTKKYTAFADGLVAATVSDPVNADLDVTLAYVWKKGETVIEGATTATYTPAEVGDYTLTVSYVAADGKTYSSDKTVTVIDPAAQPVVYTLVTGEGTITITAKSDNTYTATLGEQTVESGTYAISADGKQVTTTPSTEGAKSTTYNIGEGNVLTVYVPVATTYTWVTDGKTVPTNNDVFTFTGLSNTFDSSNRTYETVEYAGGLKTGGKCSDTRNIKVVIPAGKTGDISAIFAANSSSGAKAFIGTSISSTAPATGAESSSSTSDLKAVSATSLAAGTYYVNFDSSARFYKLEVVVK